MFMHQGITLPVMRSATSHSVCALNTSAHAIVNHMHVRMCSATFGRVEAQLTLPLGIGAWPAFFLLPVTEKYGKWPASGEIDILGERTQSNSLRL
jgi:Glycosyl hydrolases family 16